MLARRTLRRFVAFAATLAIVGAHTAAAAYACARGSDGLPFPAAAAAPCVEHMIDGAGMADGDGNANLCEVHCQDASVPVPVTPACAPPPEAALTVAARPAAVPGMPASAPDAKGAAPPARSRYCRLQL
jgi:hypothetical protein